MEDSQARVGQAQLSMALTFVLNCASICDALHSLPVLRNTLPRYLHSFCIAISILVLCGGSLAAPAEHSTGSLDMADNLVNASGYLVLINATPYQWNRTFTQSFHMTNWNFPAAVAPGTVTQTLIEIPDFCPNDKATVQYSFNNYGPAFEIALSGCNSTSSQYKMTISGFKTLSNPKGSQMTVPFTPGGNAHFILSGTDDMYVTSNLSTADWMQSTLSIIGNRSLRRICMPMSHDAGMSVDNTPTVFATPRDTLTQTKTIGQQLDLGARYFDIRPLWSQGQYWTGHYSDLPIINWQGGKGQSISEIVKELNTFTSNHPELVILELSHDYNADQNFIGFDQDLWDGLFGLLSTTSNLFTAPANTSDLSQLTLNQYIANGTGAVLVIANLDPNTNIPGQYLGNGIYPKSQFPTTGSYADTSDLNTMIADQQNKLHQYKTSPDDPVFMLSWTLTQSAEQAIEMNPSILELAATAEPSLFQNVIPACSPKSFPNLIELDNFAVPDYASLCVAINHLFGAVESSQTATGSQTDAEHEIDARGKPPSSMDPTSGGANPDSKVRRTKTGSKLKNWKKEKKGQWTEFT